MAPMGAPGGGVPAAMGAPAAAGTPPPGMPGQSAAMLNTLRLIAALKHAHGKASHKKASHKRKKGKRR